MTRPLATPRRLTTSLTVATDPSAARCLLAPLIARPVAVPAVVARGLGGSWRWAGAWPRVEVLDPGSEDLPWRRAGRLLSGLHLLPVPVGTPPTTGPQRLDRALDRLTRVAFGASDGAAHLEAPRRVVLAAGSAVRAGMTRAPAGPSTLVHGDWHLGQPGAPSPGRRLLLDLDDLGTGCPAADLGRPAGFWAAGLLDHPSWSAFLDGYRSADGSAVPGAGDVWPALDAHARGAVVIAAARCLMDAAAGWALDEEATALVQACQRMLDHDTPSHP